MKKVKFDLEDRVTEFAVIIIHIVSTLPNDRTGNHLGNQLIRSGTSPALNYGEAQSAESRKDFIHKMKLALKELRETFICLKIIQRSKLMNDSNELNSALRECDELIAIFVKSIETARKNDKRK